MSIIIKNILNNICLRNFLSPKKFQYLELVNVKKSEILLIANTLQYIRKILINIDFKRDWRLYGVPQSRWEYTTLIVDLSK